MLSRTLRRVYVPRSIMRASSSTAAAPPPATPPWSTWRPDPQTSTPADSTTLKNQGSLPRLPVPTLESTLSRLERSCAPLATDKQREELRRKVEAFQKEGGVGRRLQEQLKKRREDPSRQNWLAEWWDEQAYMAYRDSVVVNVSYYFGFDRLPQSLDNASSVADPAFVAASIAKTALEFRRLIAQGLLEPEAAGRTAADGTLCMESYKWAFNACRIPASPSDYAVKTAEAEKEAQHFVVVKRNRFYSVPIVDEADQEYGVDQLKAAVQSVIEGGQDKAPPVGILTGINRDRWTEAYSHLITSPGSSASLRSLHTAAFVICLDESSPPSGKDGIVEFSKRLWTGMDEAGNRWWDKPLQWVVFANGEAGFIGEHSCMDGTPTARLNDFLTKRLLTGEPGLPSSASSAPAPSATPLPFDLDSTSLKQIKDAEQEFAAHIAPYEVQYTSYRRYGKDGIKKMGVSPDGWVQMLFQLAYHMTFNRPTATYEAAQTRRFQLGRTETVRILTPESLAFVEACLSSSSAPSTAEKLELLRAAIKAHGQDMKLASAGTGIDRHLFGLKMLAAELPDAERKEVVEEGLLGDEVVKESGTWRMSTSQIYIRRAPSYGWGPVVGDGLGLPYMIHPESLQLTVTCREAMPGATFIRNFERAADLLMDLHEEGAK
ncbi:hypothetical protein JCM11251_006810 [Rhodosporidiobolus azoricus]